MKVQFDEGPAALLVNEVGRVERGTAVEVSKELGEQLLEQGWREVGKRKRSTTKRKRSSAKKTEVSQETTTPATGQTKEGDE